jgi:hypothetical protein
MGLFKSADQKRAIAEGQASFDAFATQLAGCDPKSTRELVERFKGDAAVAALPERQRKRLGDAAFLAYAQTALADEELTEDEEDALAAVAEAVGFTQEDFQRHGLYAQLQVAKLNGGRLPTVDVPQLLTKRDEVVHLEASAALMKEVTTREFRAASQGFSFRVAKGVRYRVGSTRGHMVNLGTTIQVADAGLLSVTNQRVIFMGDRKTIDMPYSKIAGMHLFADAISFSLTNRQNAPLIKVAMDTDVLGALLNAAVQAASH